MPSLDRIPVVAGPAYVEHIRKLPGTFTATLVPEPDNQYHRAAVAVQAAGEKIGYLPPEIARHHFAWVLARVQAGQVVECPGRKSTTSDAWTGVLAVLDFTGFERAAQP